MIKNIFCVHNLFFKCFFGLRTLFVGLYLGAIGLTLNKFECNFNTYYHPVLTLRERLSLALDSSEKSSRCLSKPVLVICCHYSAGRNQTTAFRGVEESTSTNCVEQLPLINNFLNNMYPKNMIKQIEFW